MEDRPCNLLVVDDNHDSCIILRAALETDDLHYCFPNGIEVCVAYDIPGALAVLKEKLPDAVLLDLFLPGVEETQGLKQLAEAYPELPIIIYSGHYDRDLVRKCISSGATDYIVKSCIEEKGLAERIFIAIIRHKRDRSLEKLQRA